jgi:CelD/BcsL family acetyltransferase involved in cellulose biosynthesis
MSRDPEMTALIQKTKQDTPLPAASPSHDLDVTFIRGDRSILRGLAAEWDALCDEGPCAWITYRPAWIGPFLDAWHPDGRFHAIVVRRNGQLRGLLPMVEQRYGFGPLAVRRVSPTANFYSWEFGPIYGTGDADQVIAAMQDRLARWSGWDILDFAAALDDGPVPGMIEHLVAGGAHALPPVRMIGYVIPCPPPGSGFEEAIEHSAMTRKRQLRRHLKKLGTLGTPTWHCLEPDAPEPERTRALDDFLELEASGWKGRTGEPIARDPQFLDFYRNLLRDRQLIFHRLELDGVLIAANIGILGKDRFFSMRFAYHEEYGHVSPGHLMTLYTLCDAASRGCTGMDCAGTHVGTETYKTSWTDQSYLLSAHMVFARGIRGNATRLAWTRGIPLARKLLRR